MLNETRSRNRWADNADEQPVFSFLNKTDNFTNTQKYLMDISQLLKAK